MKQQTKIFSLYHGKTLIYIFLEVQYSIENVKLILNEHTGYLLSHCNSCCCRQRSAGPGFAAEFLQSPFYKKKFLWPRTLSDVIYGTYTCRQGAASTSSQSRTTEGYSNFATSQAYKGMVGWDHHVVRHYAAYSNRSYNETTGNLYAHLKLHAAGSLSAGPGD